MHEFELDVGIIDWFADLSSRLGVCYQTTYPVVSFYLDCSLAMGLKANLHHRSFLWLGVLKMPHGRFLLCGTNILNDFV